MTQEFVTLPREVVERAIAALDAEDPYRAAVALRTALDQPQNHVSDAGNMVPAGWKLVPSDATHKWAENLADRGMRISSLASAISDMLAAAPQPPTTEQSSAVEQQQGEQEPVALLADAIRSEPTELIHKWRVLELVQDHARQQPRRELMDNEARRIYNEATYHASLAVFMTRMDAEHPDADDKGVSGWLQEAEYRVKRRITEREPLTDEQIEKICPSFDDPMRREMWKIGFKAAHNIK